MNIYHISEDLFESAQMSWEELTAIYRDFCDNKYQGYQDILDAFIRDYLKDTARIKVHSIRYRVKDAEHLLAKIIRKKQNNHKKYRDLDKTNYEKFITDLIGIRCLVLFKEDWKSFHNYILSQFENNVRCYVKDSIRDFDEDENHFYIAEKPKAHIRSGDAREIYDEVLPPDCVLDGKIYRSVHYILKYKGVYLEIQVRTLFEEGWGEVDHAIVYPHFQDDQLLKKYTELLNRLSGLADEMGSFFCYLKELQETSSQPQAPGQGSAEGSGETRSQWSVRSQNPPVLATPGDCLKSVLDE